MRKLTLLLANGSFAVFAGLLVLLAHSDSLAAASISPERAVARTGICDSVTEIPLVECEALVALYDNTSGSTWTHNNQWMTTITPCNWYFNRSYSA